VHFAEHSLRRGALRTFVLLWSLTIALGIVFLLGTAYEWRELIVRHHLTISANLFGTTYYTLVGFHAFHVTVGVIVLSLMLVLVLRREVTPRRLTGVELTSWYWHFVDGVWVVVFTVVYLVGR
jgi:cytochrome c oxidase subunit III